MKKIAVMSFAILLTAWSAFAMVSSTPELGTHALYLLGTVEGKSFYLEKIDYNWTLAKQRCEEYGMHLATVTTQTQLTFLKTFYNVTSISYYWTGARDSQTTSQFVWDYSKEPLISSLFTGYTRLVGIQTCLSYRALSATSASFFFEPCSARNYCLCERKENQDI